MEIIRAKRVIRVAEKLHLIQDKKRKLQLELRKLEEDESFYARILKTQVGGNFKFNGEKYIKKVVFSSYDRQIMDQRKVRAILGTKTPYRTSTVDSVKVDFVYE